VRPGVAGEGVSGLYASLVTVSSAVVATLAGRRKSRGGSGAPHEQGAADELRVLFREVLRR